MQAAKDNQPVPGCDDSVALHIEQMAYAKLLDFVLKKQFGGFAQVFKNFAGADCTKARIGNALLD